MSLSVSPATLPVMMEMMSKMGMAFFGMPAMASSEGASTIAGEAASVADAQTPGRTRKNKKYIFNCNEFSNRRTTVHRRRLGSDEAGLEGWSPAAS
ncbi:unnamed protein product [Urochloa humidicola]